MSDDKVDKRKVNLAYGAKVHGGGQLTQQVIAPEPGEQGTKNAERLRILVRAPSYQKADKAWLDRLEQKFHIGVTQAARKVGFGLWKKKFPTPAALVDALQAHFLPLLCRDLGRDLPPLHIAGDDLFLGEWPALPGEPPLHPEYVDDTNAFGLIVFQEEVKHVAHAYVMAIAHGFIRCAIAERRTLPDSAPTHGLTPEQLYVLEANLCQYYVPHHLAAYFENQPMRLLARELANRFRKVAFGGQ